MSRGDDHIMMMTDGATWDYDEATDAYLLTSLHSKAVLMPHITAVMGSQGAGDFLPLMYWNRENNWPTFDALVKSIDADMDWTFWHIDRCYGGCRNIMICVYVGGLSVERGRFEIYCVCMDRDGKLFPLKAMPATCFAPTPDDAAFEQVGLVKDDKGERNLNGFVDIGLMMQAMRLTKTPMGARENPPSGHCLGGHIQFTRLTRDTVVTKIVHRWDDEMGKPIEPKEGEIEAIKESFRNNSWLVGEKIGSS